MKKLAVVVSAILALSLAAPAIVSAEFTFDGKLESKLEYSKNNDEDRFELKGWSGLKLETGFEAGSEELPLKAVVELGGWAVNAGLDENDQLTEDVPFDQLPGLIDTAQLEIQKAYLQADGPFWNGGPSLVTRIGDVTIDYDNWMAYLGDKKGVTIDDVKVGPAEARFFYAWKEAYGAAVNARVKDLNLNGVVIRHDDDVQVGGGAELALADNISLAARFALDRAHSKAYQFDATFIPVENVTLTGMYRAADDGYAAEYQYEEQEDEDIIPKPGEARTRLGVDTELAGFQVSGSAELEEMKLVKNTVGLRKELELAGLLVNGAYDLTMEHGDKLALTHALAADTSLNMIPHLQNVNLAGNVTINPDSTVEWGAHAGYAAPNGIELGAHYDSADGASVTAGVAVEF